MCKARSTMPGKEVSNQLQCDYFSTVTFIKTFWRWSLNSFFSCWVKNSSNNIDHMDRGITESTRIYILKSQVDQLHTSITWEMRIWFYVYLYLLKSMLTCAPIIIFSILSVRPHMTQEEMQLKDDEIITLLRESMWLA